MNGESAESMTHIPVLLDKVIAGLRLRPGAFVIDGTLGGAAIAPAMLARQQVDVPIVYGGGVSGPEDFIALARVGVDGIAAGALWQFTAMRPDDAKDALAAAGYPVRQRVAV